MSKIRITSPVEGLNTTSAIGPVVLNFKDSVAEVEEDAVNDGLRRYLEDSGYGVGDQPARGRDAEKPEPADPRKVQPEQIGTRIRDAAVDPRDSDFLAPTNAGEANPHGSEVVNPEIHASQGIRPVKAGPVHVDDADEQDSAEKAHAAAATDGTPVVLTAEEQELLGVDAHGRPTEPDSTQIVGDPDDVEEDDLPAGEGTPDSESTGDAQASPADAETPVDQLQGQALTDALKEAGLPATGSAKEKRARLAEHRGQAGA